MSDLNSAQETHHRRSPLFLATLGAVAVFALAIAGIFFFGSAKDGYPQVTLPLTQVAQAPQQQTGETTAPSGAARRVNGNLVADPALIEDSAMGPLPKVGADGNKPMAAYAAPFSLADKRPRIALVLTGLGISSAETTLAMGRLPAMITFAFSPYAEGVQALVDQARGRGHEVLVEIPMEPFDFPDSDPGPRTLMVAASPAENQKRLAWMMSRFTGYAGAVNSQGGRFLSEASALEPVIGFLAHRGVLWVDVSNGDNSATAGAAGRQKAAAVDGAMRIDAIQTPDAIDSKLLELEDRARGSSVAVGVASAYPVSIDRIAAWAQSVQSRGFVLAPVTATATRTVAAHRP